MAMKMRKVEYESGEVSYFQVDESEPQGKAWEEAHKAAVADDDSPVKKVSTVEKIPSAEGPKGGT